MHLLLGVSTTNGVIGWALIGVGVLAILLAVAASSLEAFRKALQSSNSQLLAGGEEKPWDKVFELIAEILKELMGKTGGPPFFMGIVLVVLGILVLNEKLF
jgi:hypothetical protein